MRRLALALLLMATPAAAFNVVPVPAVNPPVTWPFLPHGIPGEPLRTLHLYGCRGERLQAAFYLLGCTEGVTDLWVTAGKTPGVDLRWIKDWWQAGRTNMENDRPVFAPELLLHDGNLVQSNWWEPGVNAWPETPQDAERLLPLTLPNQGRKRLAEWEQGVFLTVQVPPQAEDFEFTLRLSAAGHAPLTWQVQVHVWPFPLAAPGPDYSMYYRAQVNRGEPDVSAERRTPTQMLADLRCLAERGVTNPATAVPEHELAEVLKLRTLAGCSNARLFSGACLGSAVFAEGFNKAALPQLEQDAEAQARRLMDLVRPWGVQEVYLYGKDESQADGLHRQEPLWRAARRVKGVRIYGAVSGMAEWDLLRVANFLPDHINKGAAFPTPELMRAMHQAGRRVYLYGKPGGGNEDPEGFRRQQGLRLWLSGADGAMEYAFMHVWLNGHPWDEFGNLAPGDGQWRSHMMAYPTIDGVVPTLQLEGLAAGVTDVRYLRTAQEACEGSHKRAPHDAWRVFRQRLEQEQVTIPLDEVRRRCAELTVTARSE